MNLQTAANYFATTEIQVFDGYGWAPSGVSGAYLPADRFISDREFDARARFMLTNPDTPLPDDYRILRFASVPLVFIRGNTFQDIQVSAYSDVTLLMPAPLVAQIIELEAVNYASGMKGATRDKLRKEVPCDLQRISALPSREYHDAIFTGFLINLPSDAPATKDTEILIGTERFSVLELYPYQGFLQARAAIRGPS